MGQRSERNLIDVNPRLVAVVRLAHERMASDPDGLSFIVTEGRRSIERQAQLVKAGASRTMASYHLRGDAVDIAVTMGGEVHWDWPLYEKLSHVFKRAARDLKVNLTWGGDWSTLRDGPHYQIEA
jgi:peptidoglycan L-alanyl-D-glutamate endopeptidase CwlK